MQFLRGTIALPRCFVMLVCGVIFAMLWAPAGAQEYRAGVTGTISDQSGAVVPGASVTLHNQATGVETSTKSDKSGDYVLNYIDPGTYLLSVDAAGFRRWEMHDIHLDTAQAVRVNMLLKPADTSSSVTVVSGNTILENANADITQLFDTKDFGELPIPDGNPAMVLQLIGGSVWAGNATVTRLADNGAISAFYVNGVPGASMFYLNGIPNNGVDSSYSNQSMAFVPPTDAVDQVKQNVRMVQRD